MKLLVEWAGVLFALFSSCVGTLVVTNCVSALFINTGQTHASVELSDFVCVLARSWHFDGARPVEVEVTKRER